MPHRRRPSPSPFLSPPLLIIIIPILLLLLLFLTLPPLLSFTSHLLHPTSLNKSWHSLNILLVLFALLCGIFAKQYDHDDNHSPPPPPPPSNDDDVESRRNREWYGFPENNKAYDSPPVTTGVSRLRRSSSSYPDLRQQSLWDTEADRYTYRFHDDFEIHWYRSPEQNEKEIHVDMVEISGSPMEQQRPAMKPPPPPPPPPPRKSRRNHQPMDDDENTRNPSPPPPPSPPHTAATVETEGENKRGRKQRRKSDVKREIATMWASALSNQRKRKRKHNIHREDDVSTAYTPQPPPPPPPPPPSLFHVWFKKGSTKNKKIHSVSTPPPAPPPPPPLSSSKRWTFRKPKIPPPPPPPPATEPRRRRDSGRPPLPAGTNSLNLNNYVTSLNTGNQSPLMTIPPAPPPPPPFRIPAMRFKVRGDFVKIRSTSSSRCGSPDPEDDPETKDGPQEVEVGMGGSLLCPSPDVNVKAASFIARLRGEWKLEKINSLKEKQNLGLHGLGPIRQPGPSWS